MERVNPVPEGFHTVTPYVMTADARGFIDFARRAFGAEQTEFVDMGGGHIHAEIRIGDSMLMIGQSQSTPAAFYLYVEAVDELYRRAIAAGAVSLSAPKDQFYGNREAGVKDSWGNTWYLATRIEKLSTAELEGRAPRRA